MIQFPRNRGNPRWNKPGNELFLGIDHTAIVVADTERGLPTYQGHLGFMITGMSENYGTKRAHLNNVFGARLRIAGLRVDQGLGKELLEYLTPTDGSRRRQA